MLAIASLEAIAVDERNITSLTVALSRRQNDRVCERIAAFRQELLLAAVFIPAAFSRPNTSGTSG